MAELERSPHRIARWRKPSDGSSLRSFPSCRSNQPAHGFIAGRSILTNSREHANRAIVVNLDLEDFFPSIGFPRVRKRLQARGLLSLRGDDPALFMHRVSAAVMEYDGVRYFAATGTRGLPQGACTSPGLSNQVARRLDRRLGGLASKLGVSYTRYADDLTFSGDEELEGRVGYLFARVRQSPKTKASPSTRRKVACCGETLRRSSPGWWSTTGLGWRGRRCAGYGRSCIAREPKAGEPEPRRAA